MGCFLLAKNLKYYYMPKPDAAKKAVILAIAVYTLIFGALTLWKYFNFAYNAMDLAIINQVFYHSSLGNLFGSSIHAPTYLGDHFSPILLLLLPIYLLYKSPITLLLLQTVILALSAWPLYLITKKLLSQPWAAAVSLIWLLNPFVQNINLFEFSFLPLAVFFIFWSFYFYQDKNFWPFVALIGLALLAREDVALVTMTFGFLAVLEKRKLKWSLTPIILSVAYFILSLKITALFADAGQYKFLVYYSWLGSTPLTFIQNALLKPWLIISHLAQLPTLEFILAALLPFAFLPLVKPKNLILGSAILAQLALGSAGLSATLLYMHYASLFLPALFISLIYGLDYIINQGETTKSTILRLIRQEKKMAALLFFITVIYASLTLGPLPGSVNQLAQNGLKWTQTEAKKELIKKIPPQAKVAATYDFLANLSSRPDLYSFNYAFLGQRQFLSEDYQLPADTEYLLIDYKNLISYQLQYQQNPFYQQHYQTALAGWAKTLDGFGLIALNDTLALYQKGAENQYNLVTLLPSRPKIEMAFDIVISQELEFLGYNQLKNNHYQLFWQPLKITTVPYRFQLSLWQDGKKVKEKIYPLGYDILAPGLWPIDQIVQTDYWFSADKTLSAGDYQVTSNLVAIIKGGLDINGIRSAEDTIDQLETLAEPIALGEITVE